MRILVLGIETSCDETAVAVLEKRKILSNLVISQIAIHRKYQGIVPELACRKHLENINSLITLALREAKVSFSNISAVAVTNGPGLVGALLIGVMAAKAIAYAQRIPLVPVNHLEGHIFANFLETRIYPVRNSGMVTVRPKQCRASEETPEISNGVDADKNPKPPFLALIVSGGHTDLILVKRLGEYQVLGRTRDDAVGEAYDKVAKLLKLGYPGGPIIDRLAKEGNPAAINFPRPYLWDNWDFSFSGLKTSVVNYVSRYPASGIQHQVKNIVASFQAAVIETLVKKTLKAAKSFKVKKIVLGGGVSANSGLRAAFNEKREEGWEIYYPQLDFCTDNAAMIACAAYYKMRVLGNRGWGIGKKKKISRRLPITYHPLPNFKVDPNLPLTNWNEKNS